MKFVKLTCGLFLVLCLVRPITSDGQGDHELWKLLRYYFCNDMIVEAWQELAGRPQTEENKYSGEQIVILLDHANVYCTPVVDMQRKFVESKEKVDRSALEAIEVLLSDDIIERCIKKNDQELLEPEQISFTLDESLSVIDSQFRNILDNEMKRKARTSSRIQAIIDKYIFSACAEYNTKMHKTIEKLTRISIFIEDFPYYNRQVKWVQNSVFRYMWCEPFTIEEGEGERKRLKQHLLEIFNPQKA